MDYLVAFLAGFGIAAYLADIYIKGLRRAYKESGNAS